MYMRVIYQAARGGGVKLLTALLQKTHYRWMPHNADFGFLERLRAVLLVDRIYF
jgi:hypothetical protein